ncbi:MAG: hypothetical protein HYR96_04040 [Deltaproteobacteria bacterium]|nr:hypothetical protein [Deltaproteobacteria bacterium]MBI3295296.1 hypothetical protein [Deltaproteobacteria bacterium]
MRHLNVLALGFFFCLAAMADFKILNNAAEFNSLVQTAEVPVVVQFSAYWCGPCQELRATFSEVAHEFTDNQVILAYVDAYENPELKSYLQGGYPTVRTFTHGKLAEKSFVGSNTTEYVRSFIKSAIGAQDDAPIGGFCAL